MKTPPYLLVVIVASLALSSCAQMAVGLASSLLEDAIDRDRDKDRVRAHLRHGDTVEQAQKGAFEERFFEDMMWLE